MKIISCCSLLSVDLDEKCSAGLHTLCEHWHDNDNTQIYCMSLILTISQYFADVVHGFKHSSTEVSNQTNMPLVALNIVPHNAIGEITRICAILCFMKLFVESW